ncbi:hypothetical protein [Hymenobacter latericus]|uniref:hypothetical protein n=1 Tax=Hymenobacter sp. YIM 151858-1 TaxID=2987688 RepID=UPI0022264894|nr:hypothetical protein [Hymenobacter sp. YIM 151858-1]UYZ60148.1 hypothetical protein OIS50_04935 [Hymenobacter sp. YIM 151858-1]
MKSSYYKILAMSALSMVTLAETGSRQAYEPGAGLAPLRRGPLDTMDTSAFNRERREKAEAKRQRKAAKKAK